MPDGSAFEYKENAEPSTARGVARNGSYASPISSASTSIVAENPEDVKFDLRAPVENSGNLIAVHNLTEEKLKKALKLGGFPMPSIAIAKTDIGHQNFVGISLVFGKDTIDPKADRKNKVYSANVWSPTFPRIEYEVDAKVENRVRETLGRLGDSMESYLRERLKRVVYGIDEYLNRFEGEEGFIEWAVNNYGLKAAFLEDQGRHVDMVKVEKPMGKSYSEDAASVFQQIIELFGGDLESVQRIPLTQIREEYGTELERIDPKYLAIGVARNAAFQNSRRAEANVGICLWKSLGFYDTNISRNVREMVKHGQSVGDRIKEKSLILAEKGDAWTMGMLYGAVEAEMADKHPGVAKGSRAYSEMVNARVREIVYPTQVVDSTMTHSDIMRDTKTKSSLATAFMSEPTLTMNMLADSIYEQRMKARESGKKLIAPSQKMVRAFAVNAVVLAFSSVVEAAFTAWRDDDEYETFAEKFDKPTLARQIAVVHVP